MYAVRRTGRHHPRGHPAAAAPAYGRWMRVPETWHELQSPVDAVFGIAALSGHLLAVIFTGNANAAVE